MYALLIALVSTAQPQSQPPSQRAPGCEPSANSSFINLIGNIRHEMHNATTMYGISWQLADTATLRPVTSDSLCQMALTTIQHYMDADLAPKGITLIYAGQYFVAQQREQHPGSEFTSRYILDHTLRQVIWPCPNAFSPPPGGVCPPRKP